MTSVSSSSSSSSSGPVVSPTRRYPPLKIRVAPGAPRISRVAPPRFDSALSTSAVPAFPDLSARRPIEATEAEKSRKKSRSEVHYRSKIMQRDIHAGMLATTLRELQAMPQYSEDDTLIGREQHEALMQMLSVYKQHFSTALADHDLSVPTETAAPSKK